MIYVLDTHPIVWFVEKSERLSDAARAVMLDPTTQFVIPTIALSEIKFLYAKKRITASYASVQQDLINTSNCTIYPADEQVVSLIPTNLNIHDAIVVATSLVYRDLFKQKTTLITKDKEIEDSKLIDILW